MSTIIFRSSPAQRGRGTMRSMVEGATAQRPFRRAPRDTSPASLRLRVRRDQS